MGERPSEYARAKDDWYVEPRWCVEILRDRVRFSGDIHDPCCGMGTIPAAMGGTGADLKDRGHGYPVRDFLRDTATYDNIVFNPPYNKAQVMIERALTFTRGKVAALLQVKFLASQGRYELFVRPELETVIILSRRPSMPPGWLLKQDGEKARKGGSIDFCWVVWDVMRPVKNPTIEWGM